MFASYYASYPPGRPPPRRPPPPPPDDAQADRVPVSCFYERGSCFQIEIPRPCRRLGARGRLQGRPGRRRSRQRHTPPSQVPPLLLLLLLLVLKRPSLCSEQLLSTHHILGLAFGNGCSGFQRRRTGRRRRHGRAGKESPLRPTSHYLPLPPPPYLLDAASAVFERVVADVAEELRCIAKRRPRHTVGTQFEAVTFHRHS
jgi:hypothetical protein